MRLVDRVVLHEGPVPFTTLAERVVGPDTRFLILDLDRTVHLGRNLGELLGWELSALAAFGPDELERMEEGRPGGRMLFHRGRPLASLRYLARGVRTWALPGLYYLLFGKLPAQSELLRRWTYRRFGPEPVRTVQRVPQETLLALVADAPETTLRMLAERIWDRHAGDQVIHREDLDRLRRRHPDLRVVVTSASPRVMVEVARDRLGVDHVEWSEPGRINSGPAKIARLAERLPEVLDPAVETVGISDTGYGEDHCWARVFTRVVDINSDTPFPPLVPRESPLREVHSALVSTRREQDLELFGYGESLDPRRARRMRSQMRIVGRAELADLLGDVLERARALSRDDETNACELDGLLREARLRLEAVRTTGTDLLSPGAAPA